MKERALFNELIGNKKVLTSFKLIIPVYFILRDIRRANTWVSVRLYFGI